MKYTPHDYQKRAEDYIVTHPIAAVFLSMGLGKTVITLSAINRLLFDSFDVFKVLVITPLRVARDTWKEELEKWDYLNAIRYSIAVGSEKERLDALKRDADIYIINRENVEWLIDKSCIPFDFDMIVVDELSSFKSGKAKRFKSLLKVRPRVKRIVGLTGTPASNGLIDLWAEFRILDMGHRLGRFITAFRNEYFTPDKRNQNIIFSYKLRPGAEEKIYKRIEDITLSMKALDYLEMPKLMENTVKVHMSPDEKSAYKELKKGLVLELQGEKVAALSAASLASKLMQAASGAIYKEDGSYLTLHDKKLDALEERIEAAYGQSVLVSYWFKFDKERIVNLLNSMKVTYAFLDTSDGIRAWKEKRVQIGLIHPASAGHGINIQAGGNILIWYTVPWSLELYDQTVARLWRQGQSKDTVVVEHLVTDETIDERILKAIKKKDVTQDSLMDAVKATLEVSDED